MDDRFDVVLSKLDKAREKKAWGQDVVRMAEACCPAHDDKTPSLSVREFTSGWIDPHCFAGCTREDIVSAIGMRISDLGPNREWRPEPNEWRDEGFCISLLLIAQSARMQSRKRTDQDRKDEVRAYKFLSSVGKVPSWYEL